MSARGAPKLAASALTPWRASLSMPEAIPAMRPA
jgi:hypothetical protein